MQKLTPAQPCRIIDIQSMSTYYQSCSILNLFLLLQMSINGQAFIIFCPKAHRFAEKPGTTLQFARLSQSNTAHFISPRSSPRERRSCSRQEAMKDDCPPDLAAGELYDGSKGEWQFARRAVTRLSNLFDAVRRFLWTSFHRLLVVRFIWLMQTTASLKSVLLDSTRSFSSSNPQVSILFCKSSALYDSNVGCR